MINSLGPSVVWEGRGAEQAPCMPDVLSQCTDVRCRTEVRPRELEDLRPAGHLTFRLVLHLGGQGQWGS